MRYLLALIGAEGEFEDATPEEMKAEMDRWAAYGDELSAAGAFVSGEGLSPSNTATTIRVNEDGERVTTDGPYAETKEQLGGFYVLECENLDEALEWARKAPIQSGGVEVRPVMDYEAFGYEGPENRQEVAS